MSDSLLPPEILGLPLLARITLVEELWDSIAAEEQSFELSESQQAELDRRLELRQGTPDRGSAWTVVKQRLLNQL
jgi:putative addiction module component (TIGR02574 family)